jgi:hypothetical protein
LLVLAGGCGSDGGEGNASSERSGVADKTLPVDQYVARADDVCRTVAKRVLAIQEELPTAQDPKKAADLLTRQLDAVRDMREGLAALGAPEGKRELAVELVADIEDAEPHLEDTIEALRDGDEQRAGESVQRYSEASMESARQVRESGLDFEVCGSGA